MSKFIATRRHNPCPVCGDIKGKCRHLPDSPDTVLCMTATDAYSAPPGWQFLKLTSDGLWGIIRRDTGEINEELKREWAERTAYLRIERLRIERTRHATSLTEGDRNTQIRDILGQLRLSSRHREDLQHRGLNDELIEKGKFKSVEQWQKLDLEVSYRLAGVALGGRSLITPQTGYLCPVWNPEAQIVGWQLRVDDNSLEDVPKYLWATSRTRKRPQGATVHFQNGELPLTFCTPANDVHPLAQYIGIAEGILKPWIISQLRSQIVIGAAGGQFASSPETFKRYLEAASTQLGSCKNVLLWADAGAIANKNVMRQYRRTYELATRWGYTLRVAWWGQLDKSCADPDEYRGEYEILTWAQFESLSRNPSRFWDDVKYQLRKVKKLFRRGSGFNRRVQRLRERSTPTATIIFTPDQLPTPAEYIKLGCPRIIYMGDERVTIWKEAVAKGWCHIFDKSVPGVGKSHTAGSMRAHEFDVRQLFYNAADHRNPTTLTVEKHFVDLPPRHNGLVIDKNRTTPMGRAFTVHPTGNEPEGTNKVVGNCHRTPTFRALSNKNINNIEGTENPICAGCHLRFACQTSTGPGFGYRNKRMEVLKHSEIRAHPQSLPLVDDYEYGDVGMYWDEASGLFTTKKKIEVTISDFNQTVGELAIRNPELFVKLHPIFEKLRWLWEKLKVVEDKGQGEFVNIAFSHGVPESDRYGYNDTAIRQLLLEVPEDIADTIEELDRCLKPDLSFLADSTDGIDTTSMSKKERDKLRTANQLLRQESYREAKRTLDSISLNWLVPMLEVWAFFQPGALHFDKGILSIYVGDNRHQEVARAAKFNIYLDGTMDVHYLALKLGVVVENILQIEQVVPSYENLTVIQVTGMGVLGRDRRESMIARVMACREGIINKYEGLSVAIIERKAFALDEDGYHFRDSRGVNRFKDVNVLVSMGIPYPNIGELAAEYQILMGVSPDLEGDQKEERIRLMAARFGKQGSNDYALVQQESDLDYQEFIDSFVRAEILQEAGRLRSHLRPEEELIYYFVGDFDLEFFQVELPGCKFETKQAIEIDFRAADYGEQTKIAIVKACADLIAHQVKPTQEKIEDELKEKYPDHAVTQERISQIANKSLGGWKGLPQTIAAIIKSLGEKGELPLIEEHEPFYAKVYLPLLSQESPIKAVVGLVEFALLMGTRFGTILQHVLIDVRSQLLRYAFCVMKIIGVGMEWLIEELSSLLDTC
ncbi:hypothetical protein [Nostoc sp. 'Peltigera membranacea cyanobiont' 232]|uniref:hypothetical protein n=1 Tax=Nostoc sp. 'Peltigera membranacea cyanobiont' 232 TaxID=2014531 RepID=UPI001CB94B1E|nr:hypothetical protein [Nostoc sp. 'Peltigera membranacea cyanobiont' 232]